MKNIKLYLYAIYSLLLSIFCGVFLSNIGNIFDYLTVILAVVSIIVFAIAVIDDKLSK